MTIKRTTKYKSAVAAAMNLGLSVAVRHTSADQVYTELESSGFYWDSRKGNWIERPKTDPRHEMDKSLIRVRITAHMDYLAIYSERIVETLQADGFTVQEVSKPYPNVRDSDGAGRVYIALVDSEER
jgi:hypothetical protein